MAKKEKDIKEKTQKNSYFKEMKSELKKVVWPTPKELVNNTIAVIVFVLILAIIVFVFDFCFDNLNKYGITTLQEKVKSSFEQEKETDEEVNDLTDNSEENTGTEENVNDEESQNAEEVVNEEQTTTDGGESSTEEQNNANAENNSSESNE